MIENNGQAGAIELGARGQNTSRFSFDSQNDAINFGHDLAEKSKDWLISSNINVAKRYIEGDINLCIHLRSATEPHIFNLICRREPSAVAKFAARQKSRKGGIHTYRGRSYWDERAMRIGVPYSVEANQQIIASRIWSEPDKGGVYFRRNVREFPGFQFAFKMNLVVSEGESRLLGIDDAKGDGGPIDSVVERAAQVAYDALDEDSKAPRQLSSQTNFMNALSGISVHVDNCGKWATIEKALDGRFEFINIGACCLD
jgi:hypothetical protein